MIYIKHAGTLTITVSRTLDGDFALTRMRGTEGVAETSWFGSWLAVCDQLRKWNVDDNRIQSIQHQLTKAVIAAVQTDLSLG